MNIAVLAPVLRAVPPKAYGGIESIIAHLCLGAANAGHKVVLYAPAGSKFNHPNIKIRYTTKSDIYGNPAAIKAAEEQLFQRILREQHQFDIIHSHIEPYIARTASSNYLASITTPVMVTMHNQTYIDEHISYYRNNPHVHRIHYTFISRNQAKPLRFLPFQSVIYNALPLSSVDFNPTPSANSLLFLGRISPEKGIVEAISIAKKANTPLTIAAVIDDTQREFYRKRVEPYIDGKQIKYIGEISADQKSSFLGNGAALLFPIKWHEPFGLVVIEALASGTPVIGAAMGSIPEIIRHGSTGYIVPTNNIVDGSVEAIKQLGQISRQDCRLEVANRFTDTMMVDEYMRMYQYIGQMSAKIMISPARGVMSRSASTRVRIAA